jgi:hypothetical protein
MKSTLKNGIFTFEIDGYAVELYKEGEMWLDKIYTKFGHVINRVGAGTLKMSAMETALKKDTEEARELEKSFKK